MSCIVTDAKYRMTVSIIRALAKAGVRVTAVEDRLPLREIIGFQSKYVAETRYITSARVSYDRFIDDLIQISPGHAAVIPVTTDSILAIAQNQDKLQGKLKFIVADAEMIRLADDKASLLKKAEDLGVPVPFTTTLNEGEEVKGLARRITYPAVVKYRAGEKLGLHAEQRYAIVKDKEKFIDVFTAMHQAQPFPLVQEYLPGGGFGVSAFFNREEEPVVLFCHRRIREYPVSGGPSCLCESVDIPLLKEYAVRLLKGLRWKGVAMVEFKGAADGSYRLMEVNPRVWGSFPLTVIAGVNFPLIMYKTIIGETVEPVLETPQGIRMRYLVQDLLSLKGYWRLSNDKAGFIQGVLRDFTGRRTKDGLFTSDDPGPGLYYLYNIFAKLAKRKR